MNFHEPLADSFRLNKFQKQALKKLGLESVQGLLYFFPSYYSDYIPPKKIFQLEKGEKVSVFGRLEKLKSGKTFRTKKPFAEGLLTDDTGKIKIFWFSQPYLAKMFQIGSLVKAEGKVSERKGEFYF